MKAVNFVALSWLDIADTDAFDAFMQSDAAKASKAEDGVKDATMRVFVEVDPR